MERTKENIKALISWANAQIDEMECRGDEDCDHCLGYTILEDLRDNVIFERVDWIEKGA